MWSQDIQGCCKQRNFIPAADEQILQVLSLDSKGIFEKDNF